MSIGQRSTLFRYGFAVLAVLLTAAARLALEPLLVERAPFLPFVLAILVTVFWSGVAPAIVSVALSLLFGLYFSALGDLQRGAWLEAAIFLLTSAGLILVARAVNRARGAAHDSDKRATVIAEELNLLIDGAEGHAIYMLDPTGHVTIWNSGAERIHDYVALVARIKERGMDPAHFAFYLQAFQYGMPPHGGCSTGLERFTMKMLELENVKEATLFPRDMNRIDVLLSESPSDEPDES